MENLDINKFNPQKAELQTLTDSYKQLEIAGVEDKEGYEKVKGAIKHLKETRISITKTGKAMRQEALDFQKKVISVEKELLAVIEPTEELLEGRKEVIDQQIAMEKRKKNLPVRRDKLATNGLEAVADELLLVMDDMQFEAFFNQKLAEKLQREKDEQERQRLAFEAEKRKFEEEQRVAAETAKRVAEVEEKAKADAAKQIEEANQRALDAERKAKEAEDLRIKEEADKKQKALEEEQRAKEEAERNQKVQAFFTKHGCTGFDDKAFMFQRTGDTISLFKYVESIQI